MDRTKILGCLTLLSFLCGCSREKHIAVGSKNFTEQQILGEIVAQHLEHRLKEHIDRKLGLGGTLLAHQALSTGQIDVYPEYTGTAFTNVLKHAPLSDPKVVFERLKSEYASGMNLTWLDPLGFDNSFALVVREEDARARHLETLSDAARDPAGFVLGAGYEFAQRPDGFAMFNSAYKIHWKGSPKTMELGLLYQALSHNQVDMVAGSATDGALSVINGTLLADDKHIFPPYQACLVARSEILASRPDLRQALSELSGKIPTETMRKMNHDLDGKHRSAYEVAREFLEQNGL